MRHQKTRDHHFQDRDFFFLEAERGRVGRFQYSAVEDIKPEGFRRFGRVMRGAALGEEREAASARRAKNQFRNIRLSILFEHAARWNMRRNVCSHVWPSFW